MPAAYAAIGGAAEFIAKKGDDLAGIVVHSDHKVEIRLGEPLPIYPALLSDPATGIRQLDERGRPIGTGPFRIASFAPDRIVLHRNEEYWRGSPPLLDEVEFRPGLRASAVAAGFRAGELDLARDLLPQDLEEILRDPRFRAGLAEIPKKDTYFILFNARAGPSARRTEVRQALSGILRTRDLVWRTLGRFAQPAVCVIPPGMLGHDPGRRRVSVDRDQAREQLRAAGVSGPLRMKAAVHPLLQDRYRALTNALFASWAEIGVEVEVATPTMETFLASDANTDGFDLRIGRWVADYDDPDNFSHALFNGRSGLFRNWFSSAEADQLLEEARSEKRPAAREALYRRFETLLQDSAALVPLFHDIDYRLAGPKVRGLRLKGGPPFVNYASIGKVEAVAREPEMPRSATGTLHVPLAGVVGTLDPVTTATFEQAEVIPTLFESLTRLDPAGGRIVPWLAAELRAEEGGRTYRFRLRDDVRFHDGRRLTARDVRYSYERLLQAQDSGYRWMFAPVKGAKALLSGEAGDLAGFRIHSASEFSIELTEPLAFFPALISYPAAAIVPEGSDPSGAGGWEGCVGTGPFRLVRFEPGRHLELEASRGYWRKGYPRSAALLFTFGVSPEEILSGFRAGRFSLASELFPADAEALRREPGFAAGLREAPTLITYYAGFNSHKGPLTDRALRQRLVRAVDVSKLVRQTLGRLALPAHGWLPPGLLGHDPTPASRAGLRPSAGPEAPPPSIELTAAVHPLYFGRYAALYRDLEAALGQQGVTIRNVTGTMDEWREATNKGTVDFVVGRWGADYPDADSMVYVLHSEGGYLGRVCGTVEIDRLVERARAEAAPAARHALYREVEEIIAREALLIPIFHEQAYRFARPEVEGLSVSFGYQVVTYEDLRIRG
jgi:peptide/nickel transport system substrate-binding protein/oligopeptide transport system substrate-binding protein